MPDEGMAIPLFTRSGELVGHTIVDADMANWVGQWSWRFKENVDGQRYACRGENGKRVWLHRAILGLPTDASDGRVADHVNRDGLDNRKANLRIVTQAENMQNRPAQRGTSPYRGVFWDSRCKRWRARAQLNRVTHNIGYFATPEDAHVAASAWRREHMPFAVEQTA